MKLLYCCCALSAALFLAPAAHAQLNQPPLETKSKPSSSNPLKSLKKSDKTDEKPAKVSKEQMNETHTIAIMTVESGGGEHQIIFELLGDKAPKTVQNFIDNVDKGTYKGQPSIARWTTTSCKPVTPPARMMARGRNGA